jgi:hypothetical protein
MRRASRKANSGDAGAVGRVACRVRVVKAAGAERHERRRYADHEWAGGWQLKMSHRRDEHARSWRCCADRGGTIVLYAAYLVRVKNTLDATTFWLDGVLDGDWESLRKFQGE